MSTKFPGGAGLAGLVLLVAPIAFSAWWFTRPAPAVPPPGPALDELDVVCSGRVDAEGMVVPLDVPNPGRVVRVSVAEGAVVEKGQEILATDDAPYLFGVRAARAALTAAKVDVEFAQLRKTQFPKQLEMKGKQVAAMDAEVDAAGRKLAQMRDRTTLTKEITQTDVDVADAQVRKLKLLAEASKVELDGLTTFDPELEVRAAAAKLDGAAVELARSEKAAADCVLRAPGAGRILRLQASVGGSLAPGSPLPAVIFAPAGPFVVRAELEQSSLGRVVEGMPATVRDDSQVESPVWTGRVKRIAGWVAARRSVVMEPGELNDVRTTEVVIELDPSPKPLWIGQRMQVRMRKP